MSWSQTTDQCGMTVREWPQVHPCVTTQRTETTDSIYCSAGASDLQCSWSLAAVSRQASCDISRVFVSLSVATLTVALLSLSTWCRPTFRIAPTVGSFPVTLLAKRRQYCFQLSFPPCEHDNSWTAALSFMKFWLNMYLANLYNVIEYQGHRSKV